MGTWKYEPINACGVMIPWYVCSDCGKYPLLNGLDEKYYSEYCPHCGRPKTNASEGKILDDN